MNASAAKYGFAKWKTIYDHPANAGLKKRRPNPNLIHPGDEIVIPDRAPKEADCATGRVHKFVVKKPSPDELIVVLKRKGKPLAAEECLVEFVLAGRDSAGT